MSKNYIYECGVIQRVLSKKTCNYRKKYVLMPIEIDGVIVGFEGCEHRLIIIFSKVLEVLDIKVTYKVYSVEDYKLLREGGFKCELLRDN